MKKQYKLLAVFIAVVLVVCCCSFSVSAATTATSNVGKYLVASTDSSDDPYTSTYDWQYYTATNYSSYQYVFECHEGRTGSFISIYNSLSDAIAPTENEYVYTWDKMIIDFYIASSEVRTNSVSLCLFGSMAEVVIKLDTISINKNGSFTAVIPAGSFTYYDSEGYIPLTPYVGILLEGDYTPSDPTYMVWNAFHIRLTRCTPDELTNSKLDNLTEEQEKTNEMLGEITADKYNPPSGGEEIGDLSNTEDELLQSSEEGLDETLHLFSNFNLAQFGVSMLGVISIVNTFIDGMPWLSEIIIISLSIGIFAFLFGISGIVVRRLGSSSNDHSRKGSRKGGG